MKIPKRIEPLVDEGLVDEVVRQLMSGKEATVYVVRCGEEVRCAGDFLAVESRPGPETESFSWDAVPTSFPMPSSNTGRRPVGRWRM